MAWNDGLYDVGSWAREQFTYDPESEAKRLAGIRSMEERQRQRLAAGPTLGDVARSVDPFFEGLVGAPRRPAPPSGIGVPPPPRPAIEQALEFQDVQGGASSAQESPFAGIADGPFIPGIERALQEREAEEARRAEAERANARVNVTVNGKTYDYARGAEGGAPSPTQGRGFGKTWNVPAGGGVASQMVDNPNLTPERSIEAALRERDLEDVQPAPGRLGELGATRREARPIEASIYGREREAEIQSGLEERRYGAQQGARNLQEKVKREDYQKAVNAEQARLAQWLDSADAKAMKESDPKKYNEMKFDMEKALEQRLNALDNAYGYRKETARN